MKICTRAVVNIKGNNDHCFKWAIFSSTHKVKINSSRKKSYKKFEKYYDFSNIRYPVSIKDIKRFEKTNLVAVNIFSYKSKKKEKTLKFYLNTFPN